MERARQEFTERSGPGTRRGWPALFCLGARIGRFLRYNCKKSTNTVISVALILQFPSPTTGNVLESSSSRVAGIERVDAFSRAGELYF